MNVPEKICSRAVGMLVVFVSKKKKREVVDNAAVNRENVQNATKEG